MGRTIAVTVAWATPSVQELVAVEVPAGARAREAIERSGLVAAYGLDLTSLGIAVYGRRATLDSTLADGDRVEITRPLAGDPKDARRVRASGAKRRA
jgi:putative ubiquitin-RnfH superfamily antitoxin RatB of RatAB toxin-antitoxin module